MLGLLSRLPVEWQMGIAAGTLLAVTGGAFAAYFVVDHAGYRRGYDKADAEWQVKWDEHELEIARQRADERDRQDTINTNAKLREAQTIAAYEAGMDDLRARNAALEEEAAAAPGADDVVFGPDAIARYNRSIAR
jgi:hypothetical protein